MSTTYGTIPTEPPPSSNHQFISLANERIQSSFAARRPWTEMIQFQSLNIPTSIGESIQRIRTNVELFRINYVIILILILFLCFLYDPISLIIFVATAISWMFLYFLRNDPLVIFGLVISDGMVLVSLSIVTFLVLVLTDAMDDIGSGLCVWMGVVLGHGVLRDGGEGGLGLGCNGRDDGKPLPLKHAASSSYSLC